MRARRAEVALVLGALAIALAVIAAKQAYAEGAETASILGARLVLAAALLTPVVVPAVRAARPGPGALAAGLAAGAALWIGGRTELEGLARLPAGTLVLLIATVPVWVAAFGWAGAGRRPTPMERGAIVAVVAGVAVMAAPVGEPIDPLGAAFGLATALTFGAFLVMLDRNRGVPAASGFMLGVVGAGLMALASDPGVLGELGDEGPSVPLALALAAATVAWACLVGIGLEATDSVTASIMVSVEPVLVTALAFVLLGEELGLREIAGGVVVLAAVTAVAVSRP